MERTCVVVYSAVIIELYLRRVVSLHPSLPFFRLLLLQLSWLLLPSIRVERVKIADVLLFLLDCGFRRPILHILRNGGFVVVLDCSARLGWTLDSKVFAFSFLAAARDSVFFFQVFL